LHRLELKGAIAADWEVSENNQRVRVYRLSAAGRRQLVAERSKWDRLAGAIAELLVPPAESGS
jgi:DNA-binding PadR family transcriptional regulator